MSCGCILGWINGRIDSADKFDQINDVGVIRLVNLPSPKQVILLGSLTPSELPPYTVWNHVFHDSYSPVQGNRQIEQVK